MRPEPASVNRDAAAHASPRAVPREASRTSPGANPRANRGPAAAAGNRAAILDAARRLFAAQGFLVPLAAIAREAGVGQGVLYRHFPRGRLELAFAVFEENLAQLAAIAADPAPDAFVRLWRELLAQTVREAAFVEMVLEARRTEHAYDGDTRLRSYLADTLPRAQAAGLAPSGLTVVDVERAWRMAFGIVVTSDGADHARADLADARLLGIEV